MLFPKVALLYHRVCICLMLIDNPKLFSKVVVLILYTFLLTAWVKVLKLNIIAYFQILVILMTIVFYNGFIFISLMTNNIVHFLAL